MNSIEASPLNGRINAEAQLIDRKLVICIEDFGGGIEQSDLQRIFEPYFTKGKDRGTGLGLAIVDRILRQHGGNIQVYSQLNNGTTFVMEVPQ
jgi:signal transduction histidine kinase